MRRKNVILEKINAYEKQLKNTTNGGYQKGVINALKWVLGEDKDV
jgi:hypothetical protein